MKGLIIQYLKPAALFLFFFMSFIEDTVPGGKIITLASLLVLLFFHLLYENGRFRFRFTFFQGAQLLFACFCAASMLWAQKPGLTAGIARGEFIIFIVISVLLFCYHGETNITQMLKILMYGGYAVVIYAVLRYGYGTVLRALADESRLEDSLINANTLGMSAAYSAVINVYFILQFRRLRIRDVLLIPSVVVLAASGSRKAIVIAVVGIFGVFILKNLNNKKALKSMFKVIVVTVLLVIAVYELSKLPMFAVYHKRMRDLLTFFKGQTTRKTSGYARAIYNRVGWQLFLQHPLLGIGINNASIYIKQYYGHPHLHNNFIELLACGGIVGFSLHYSLHIYLLVQFLRHWKHRDDVYDICLVLFLLRFGMGYGHIQYYNYPNFFFLFVFWLEVQNLRRNGRLLRSRQQAVNLMRSLEDSRRHRRRRRH